MSFGIQVNIMNIVKIISWMELKRRMTVVYIFNSSLKFGNHINKMVHKANRILGLLKRSLSYLEPQMLQLLYIILNWSHLDYACVVRNTYQSNDIRALKACPTLFIFHIIISCGVEPSIITVQTTKNGYNL